MSKPVPRSRLEITYRARIVGQPAKQKLPMRFLIPGDLSGGCADRLESRPVHSIELGMKLDSFMREMKLDAPIEDPRPFAPGGPCSVQGVARSSRARAARGRSREGASAPPINSLALSRTFGAGEPPG